MNHKIETALNQQVRHELESAYHYLGMSAYFESHGFKGFAQWMRVQYHEELAHMMKIYTYLFDRGGSVVLEDLQKPSASWESPLAVFQDALKRAEFVTKSINNLVNLCIDEKDHASAAHQVRKGAQRQEHRGLLKNVDLPLPRA